MRKVFLFALFCLAGLLASCGGRNVLYIYNWGDYISPEVVKKFEKEFNCRTSRCMPSSRPGEGGMT